jgi:hypothetical protein
MEGKRCGSVHADFRGGRAPTLSERRFKNARSLTQSGREDRRGERGQTKGTAEKKWKRSCALAPSTTKVTLSLRRALKYALTLSQGMQTCCKLEDNSSSSIGKKTAEQVRRSWN